MIAREIIISALREWMAELGKRSSVAVSWIGKVKTTAQMTALGMDAVASLSVGGVGRDRAFPRGGGADAVVDAAVFERGARRFA